MKDGYLYSLIRLRLIEFLYLLPPTRAWAYKRLPQHRSSYKYFWSVEKKSVGVLKQDQEALPRRYIGPTLPFLRKRIDAAGGKKVLDAGCGWGRQMLELQGDYEVEGFDVSPEFVMQARSRGLKVFQLDIVEADPAWIEEHTDHWDVTYAMIVLEFFIGKPEDLRKAMHNLDRITKNKVLVWDYRHSCDYFKKVYPSDKFEYHHLPVVPPVRQISVVALAFILGKAPYVSDLGALAFA